MEIILYCSVFVLLLLFAKSLFVLNFLYCTPAIVPVVTLKLIWSGLTFKIWNLEFSFKITILYNVLWRDLTLHISLKLVTVLETRYWVSFWKMETEFKLSGRYPRTDGALYLLTSLVNIYIQLHYENHFLTVVLNI